ncbi:MAG: NAD(P)-binding protein [Hormoscilla sp. SP5CHS1]|nr:NAD(P)-binding protein [Hormoscilla sp. SP5CHS1]
MFDVQVIGAGIAGLTCARILHLAGYSLVVLVSRPWLRSRKGYCGRCCCAAATRSAPSLTRQLHGTPRRSRTALPGSQDRIVS